MKTLTIQDLTFGWLEEPLLKQITAFLNPGDIVHLKGENGAGKTTLLKLIAGQIPHFTQGTLLSGDIHIGQDSILTMPPGHFFPSIAFIPGRHIDFFLFTENPEQEILVTKAISDSCLSEIENRRIQFCDIFRSMNALRDTPYSIMTLAQKALSLTYVYFLQGARLYLIDEAIPEFDHEWLSFFDLLRSDNANMIFTCHQFKNNGLKTWVLKDGVLCS
ncbi:MAG: ATP-binding cassette domain-containing protein [candidate division KSB1 bacterium]|jgi:ABC-type multidrug transport system ATPase subunit|nr:ATP-binding cassette domain-containing protein [candidate division KSB1 bacterium]